MPEINNLNTQGGQKTWNLRNFENNLEKPGVLYKSHGKTRNFVQKSWKNLEFRTKIMVKPGIFYLFECFNNFDIVNKKFRIFFKA